MDSNQPVSGQESPPSSMTATWAKNVTTAHLPHSQNTNMATGTIVNIINHNTGERAQTTNPRQDDLTTTARADHEIYSSRLLTKKRGYPLWVPGPGMQLPIEYRRQGISIGDVGIITSTGEFDFLFNVFLEANHPINYGTVPQGFKPLPFRDLDIQKTVVYGPNTYLASSSVRKIATHLTSETSTDHTFESTAEEAAILVMPHGATSQDLLNTWGIRFTISRKARDWYSYAKITRGRYVMEGDMHVVVGVDKVSSWGIATSSCKTGQTASCVFKHDPTHAYKWDCTGGSGRVGPHKSEILDLIEDNTVPQNQCVFVRTINFNLSGETWNNPPSEALQQTGTGSDIFFGSRDSGNRRSSGSRHTRSGSCSSTSSHQPISMQGSLQSLKFDPVESGADHRSDELHNRSHEKFDIITEDADYISVLSDDDAEDPSRRILEAHDPQNDITTLLRNESQNQDDDSRQADENQDTNPRVPVNASGAHEPEPLRFDLLQRSPQEGPNPPAMTEDIFDDESESSADGGCGALFHEPIRDESLVIVPAEISTQEETDTSLNRGPSMKEGTGSDPQRTPESANTTLPELPEDLNLCLDLMVSDLRLRLSPLSEPRELGDIKRLAELGTSVLNYAVTFHLFSERPVLRAEEIRTRRAHYTSPKMLDNWLDLCQLKQKLRVPSNLGDDTFNDLEYFRSYVATVYVTKGLSTLQTWITELINFSGHASTSNSGPSHPSPSNFLTSPSSVYELASKQRVSVGYFSSKEGPAHQPTWTVRCLIDDDVKGVGVGKNLKIAKEEAARQAQVAMGW